jgi:hypothetical protein
VPDALPVGGTGAVSAAGPVILRRDWYLMMRTRVSDETLLAAIDEFARAGFTESFEVTGDRLRALGSRRTFGPDQVVIRGYRRFEGASDPDDMSVVYAIESQDGVRGTLVDAFGVYSDPTVSAFLRSVQIRRPAGRE